MSAVYLIVGFVLGAGIVYFALRKAGKLD